MSRRIAFTLGFCAAVIIGPHADRVWRVQYWEAYKRANPYDRELKDLDVMWQRERTRGVGPEMTDYTYNPGAACLGQGSTLHIFVYGPQKREIMDRVEELIEANRAYEGPLH